ETTRGRRTRKQSGPVCRLNFSGWKKDDFLGECLKGNEKNLPRYRRKWRRIKASLKPFVMS
uniref:Uncharacterized protein n=1 Tax=Anopheles arabiensis TaxID=7173 RepID=A0A182IFQ2_ANOAR